MADPAAAPSYGVHLLYESPPTLTKAALLPALRARIGAVAALDPAADSPGLSFHFPEYRVPFQMGTLPTQCWVLVLEKPLSPDTVDAALAQTWRWPGAPGAVGRHRAVVTVSDLMAAGLERRRRLELFQNTLLGVIDAAPPLAIHWGPSGQVVEPEAWTRGVGADPLLGAVNVRRFREPRDTHFIDTLGLAALGLPDLQIRFVDQPADEVAGLLLAAAAALHERGPVVKDGDSMRGLTPGDRWRCRLGKSERPPARDVIDIDVWGRA